MVIRQQQDELERGDLGPFIPEAFVPNRLKTLGNYDSVPTLCGRRHVNPSHPPGWGPESFKL
jgi:hypothetical protein